VNSEMHAEHCMILSLLMLSSVN